MTVSDTPLFTAVERAVNALGWDAKLDTADLQLAKQLVPRIEQELEAQRTRELANKFFDSSLVVEMIRDIVLRKTNLRTSEADPVIDATLAAIRETLQHY